MRKEANPFPLSPNLCEKLSSKDIVQVPLCIKCWLLLCGPDLMYLLTSFLGFAQSAFYILTLSIYHHGVSKSFS